MTDTKAGDQRREISRMFDAAERLRDNPGRYFPAVQKAEVALEAWRAANPEEAAAEDAEKIARQEAAKARREQALADSFIGRGLD